MSSCKGIQIVFGAAFFGRVDSAYHDKASVETILEKLASLGVKKIDTSQRYTEGQSEALLGECRAGKRFAIDTKAYGGSKSGSATEEGIVIDGLASLQRLKMEKVDVFYIHVPDPSIPLSSTLAGINAFYKRGAFNRFGLSNYSVEEVQEIHDYCKEHDYVLPTVYQGHYNPVTRWPETELFPVLRKLGISYYAYSPLAAGFLTKTKQDVLDGAGRFDMTTPVGQHAHKLYAKPAMLDALAEWEQAASAEGCERAELAYRWVCFNTPLSAAQGDGMIIGCRSAEQLEQVVNWAEKGPVSEKTCRAIDAMWEKVRHEAPGVFYSERFQKQ